MPYKNREDQRRAARRHYEANKALIKARAAEWNEAQRHKVRELVLHYLTTHPCVDCAEADPVVLEFDHRDDAEKRFSIAEAYSRGYSLERVRQEIEKCDVRCANCHRRRTAKSFDWYRHSASCVQ